MHDGILLKLHGCLAGLAIGDALGAPFEIQTHEEIMAFTSGKGVTGVQPGPALEDGDGNARHPGRTTDDTQLALAVAESLIDIGTFDVTDQARALVAAYLVSDHGWGGTTRRAAEELRLHFTSNGAKGRSPLHPAPAPELTGSACGNGVAMRIAPLALYEGLLGRDHEPLLTHVMELGLMTHGDPRASFGAVAVATVIQWLLPWSSARAAAAHLDNLKELLRFRMQIVEKRYRFYRATEDRMSARIDRMLDALDDADALRTTCRTGCFVNESVPFAIGVFLRHPTDFRAGVLEAVNAGGDADTTAAMAGAMIGANVGYVGIPKEWIAEVPMVRETRGAADGIHRVTLTASG